MYLQKVWEIWIFKRHDFSWIFFVCLCLLDSKFKTEEGKLHSIGNYKFVWFLLWLAIKVMSWWQEEKHLSLSYVLFFFLLQSSPDPVKEQILSMIQTWSTAFRKEPKYKVVQDTFNLMRMEGEVPCGIHSIFSNLP